MTNPLLAIELDPATLAAGGLWYGETRRRVLRIAERYGYAEREALAAFSALSPRLYFRANVHVFYRVLIAHRGQRAPGTVNRSLPGASRSGVMLSSIKRAYLALAGRVREALGKRAIKTRSFYLNLRGRDWEVTIDTWAAKPFGVPGGGKINRTQYRTYRNAYREAAAIWGISPAHAQASVWIHLRGAVA